MKLINGHDCSGFGKWVSMTPLLPAAPGSQCYAALSNGATPPILR